MKRSGPIARRTRLKTYKPVRRKSDRRKLAQAIDLKVREVVFARDGHRCVKCGKNQTQAILQAAHIMPKGTHQRMRFVEENILTLCVGCHIFGWHRDPLAFAQWLESSYPGLYDRLLVTASLATKVDLKELAIAYGV